MKARLFPLPLAAPRTWLAFCLSLSSAAAQTVIAPPATAPAMAPPAGTNTSTRTGGADAGIGSAHATGLPFYRRGPVSVRPHPRIRWIEADDLQFTPGQRVRTRIQEVSPGVLFELGTRWILDYSPTWITYSNEALDSTLDHAVRLAGALSHGDWAFAASQDYASASPVLFETGQQTRQETHATTFNAMRRLGARSKGEFNLTRSVRSADEFTRSIETSASGWLHHPLTSRITTALGFTAGYADVSPGSDMVYVRPQGSITWQATDKIFLNAEGGVENRRFRSGGRDDLNSPVYGTSLDYRPFSTTKFVLGAARDLSTSYFANAITRNEIWRASVEQRLLQRLYLMVRYAQYDTRYITTQRGVSAERDDRRRITYVSLSIPLLQRGSLALLHQSGRNSSTEEGFAFTSRQFGFEASYRF